MILSDLPHWVMVRTLVRALLGKGPKLHFLFIGGILHANWLATKVPLFLFFVIINFIKQFADKHRIRLVSQLSRRIKRVLQKII